jgi:hypothetical protein
MKFESVVVLETGLLIYFGMNTKMIISNIGIMIPKILYSSGLDELLQIRHQTILNTMANIIMKVPIPIPKIVPELWQLATAISTERTIALFPTLDLDIPNIIIAFIFILFCCIYICIMLIFALIILNF